MQIYSPAIDRDVLAWAAGFVDAEGCFSFTLRARFASVRVSQTHRDPLDRLAAALKIGRVRGPFAVQSPTRPSIKEQYSYYAYGARALKVSELLWPYLAGAKRLQALRMRERVRQFNPRVSQHLQQLESGHRLTRREELAWAAGFFDGDGCFSYSPAIRGMCSAILQRDRPC